MLKYLNKFILPKKIRYPFYLLVIVFIINLGAIYFSAQSEEYVFKQYDLQASVFLVSMISGIAVCVWLICFYQLSRYYSDVNELKSIKKQNEIIQNNLKNIPSNENQYYLSILHQQKELIKKYNENQDITLSLDLLQEKVNEQTYSFCNNDIINAVLTLKSHIIKEYHIAFDYQIELHEAIDMKDIHLSALLFNLMDNTIEATLDLPVEKRYIHLHISNQYQTLIISLSNSYLKGKRKTHGHGYGLVIVNNILQIYNGEYSVQCQQDKYCTYIMIYGGNKHD